MNTNISIRGARENNLQNINLDVPLNQFVVITGVFRFRKILAGL